MTLHQSQPNVDTQEVERFNALAQDWWDPTGPMWTLHAINPLRLNLVSDYTDVAMAKVLDVGCGPGLLSEGLAKRGAQVTGLDRAETSLAVARQHAQTEGLTIEYSNKLAEQLAQEQPRSFAVVCCFEVLEHVPNPSALVQACAQLVAPGGWVFFSTINRNFASFCQAIVGAEHILGLLPKGTHSYAKLIRPSQLVGWCEASGLQPVATSGMRYNPLTKSFRLCSDVSVNYFLIARSS